MRFVGRASDSEKAAGTKHRRFPTQAGLGPYRGLDPCPDTTWWYSADNMDDSTRLWRRFVRPSQPRSEAVGFELCTGPADCYQALPAEAPCMRNPGQPQDQPGFPRSGCGQSVAYPTAC